MAYRAAVTRAQKWLALALIGWVSTTAVAQTPTGAANAENVVLPDKPPNEHWVWITDMQNGQYARSILFNALTGERLGSIDTGWEGGKLDIPHTGNEIYNAAMFMSRGYRGTRTDVITAFDKHTLKPLREIIVPPKAVRGWADPNLTAASDDGRFLFIQFMTPAASIGVADLKANRFVGEIETTGCAHVMSAGNRRFLTLCGDGSILAVDLREDGTEASRRRYPFFDADRDPVHGSGTRAGNIWYFVSFLGQVHSVDVAGTTLKVLDTWPVALKEGEKTWVPGAFMQSLAAHAGKGRLYVAMQLSDLKPKPSGPDFQGAPGTQVWVFDLKTRRRVQTIPMKNPVTHIAVSQDASPYFYGNSFPAATLTVYEESTGKPLRDIVIETVPLVVQPVN